VTHDAADYPFKNLLPLFSQDDLTILNLECTLTDETLAAQGQQYPFKGKTSAAGMLAAGSVEAVGLANSHTMDYGQAGYADTVAALEGAQVKWSDADHVLVYDTKQGIRVGVASLSDPIDSQMIKNAIDLLKSQECKLIVLSLHWGEELAETPSQTQQELAREAIDRGADIIMGHHSHIVQTMEVYKNRPIFYSLGNCVYGGSTNPSDWDIALARITLTCQGKDIIKVHWMAIPGCVSSDGDANNYQPIAYAPGTADALRVYSKLGMSNAQLAEYKELYDKLWPDNRYSITTVAQPSNNE
jgi:poly-gamma-glutamate synthesis protein (capsule biosynthesis protein)